MVLALALALTGCAKRYDVSGVVLRVQPGSMLVSHAAIPGYMDAMAMPFAVQDPRELEGLAPGARVRFDLHVKRGETAARRIRVERAAPEDFRLPEAVGEVAIGQAMPDFELTAHDGRGARLSDYRGKVVAINFIYTRCPLPEVCPMLSANFARVQKRFAAAMGRDLQLLSITLDPQYDTPEVLAGYAKIWGARGDGWRFLTGDLDRIREVAGRFGLVFWPEDGAITHTSETAIVARDGRLAARISGSSHTAAQLGDLIALELEGKP